MIENIDCIICPICYKKMKKITTTHLKKHNLTMKEFITNFPNQNLVCENTKKLMGIWQIGVNNPVHKNGIWNKGKTKENDLRIEKYGKSISKTQKGFTLEERLSKEKADKIKKKMSESAKISQNKTKQKKKLSEIGKIVQNFPEVKLKKRLATCKNIKMNNGKFPGYNKQAIPIFQEFDIINNTRGIYATNPYEFQILGYSLDYINFELKIIIEVDEKQHFNKDGTYIDDDIKRQKEIHEKFPDFKFLRFKEEEIYKILKIKVQELKHV